MANLGNFLFFSETSKDLVSNSYGNPTNAGAMTIQVDALQDGASISLQVEGMNDLTRPDSYFPIKTICLGDFKAYETISAPGLYMFPIDGVQRIRIKAEGGLGTFKAYAIAVG